MEYTMINSKIKSWYESYGKKTKIDNPSTVHIDDLLGMYPEARAEQIKLSLVCFHELLKLVTDSNDLYNFKPFLIISLKYTRSLQTSAPTIREIFSVKHREPPSIGLLLREVDKYYTEYIRYTMPLTLGNEFSSEKVQVVSYYRCWLYAPDENEWDRYISLEAYPVEYVYKHG
jgi:hypothetical protein